MAVLRVHYEIIVIARQICPKLLLGALGAAVLVAVGAKCATSSIYVRPDSIIYRWQLSVAPTAVNRVAVETATTLIRHGEVELVIGSASKLVPFQLTSRQLRSVHCFISDGSTLNLSSLTLSGTNLLASVRPLLGSLSNLPLSPPLHLLI